LKKETNQNQKKTKIAEDFIAEAIRGDDNNFIVDFLLQ